MDTCVLNPELAIVAYSVTVASNALGMHNRVEEVDIGAYVIAQMSTRMP